MPENDLELAPECFWPERDFFENLYIEDIPSDCLVSIQIGDAYPELDFDYSKDARIYILDSKIGILVRHFYQGKLTPLNQSALTSILEGLVVNGNVSNVMLMYKDDSASVDEEYIEYFIYGDPGENLDDLIKSLKSSLLSLEKSFDDKVESFVNLYEQTVSSGPVVGPDRCRAVDEARGNVEKGRILEELIRDCFYSVGGIRVIDTNMRTETQEIDIVLENLANSSTWSNNSNLVLIECKNWNSRVGRSELDSFENKIKDRGGECRVGFFVAWNGVTEDFRQQLLRISREPYNIIVLDGEGIKDSLSMEGQGFCQYLENMYLESLR